MDGSNPEITDLEKDFQGIDTDSDNLITEQEMKTYLTGKHLTFKPPILKQIFMSSENKKIGCQTFISYVLASKIYLEEVALIQHQIEQNNIKKQIILSANASPVEISKEIKSSFMKFVVEDKDGGAKENSNQSSLRVEIGIDKTCQNQQKILIKQIFDKELSGVYLVLKIKVKSQGEDMAKAFEAGFQELFLMAQELDPTLGKLLKMVECTARFSDGYVWIIIQIRNLFIDQFTTTIDDFIIGLSPECQLKFHIEIQSSMFESLLSHGLNKQVKELTVDVGLDTDATTLKQFRKFANKMAEDNIQNQNNEARIVLMIMTLLEEVQLETHFKNASQFFEASGLKEIDANIKPKEALSFLKDINAMELMQSFSPNFYEFINLLKDNGEDEAELCLHFKDVIAKLKKNLTINGFFDLL